ncbi:MAG: transposase [Thermodesulfobacteriota bacterium]|nr:transposase [Thermodesulfobacteriota bacterium]
MAISINRIKSIENGIIKFLCKDRQKKIWKTMTLDAMEFIRRFLQHILPKGFYESII